MALIVMYSICANRHRAKLFFNAHSQAVRLPVEFRFSETEVDIRYDDVTGDAILSEWPESIRLWSDYFSRAEDPAGEKVRDFLANLDRSKPEEREFLDIGRLFETNSVSQIIRRYDVRKLANPSSSAA